ncbi:MAG: hypothetical protein WDZ29_02330 [Balneolaceae bacterium]
MALNATDDIRVPEVDLNTYKPTNPVEVEVVKSELATDTASPNFVRHIEFDLTGTDLEGRMIPGQSMGILAEGLDEEGNPHKVRLYSTCSPSGGEDGSGRIFATTVKRVIDEHWENHSLFLGVCSNYLCNLQPGDRVLMTGPSGKRFLLPDRYEEYNYIFLSTGTGIAPFRGMITDLMRRGIDGEVILGFGCPYRTDLLYRNLFERFQRENHNFHYIPSISREDPRPDGTKPYVQYTLIDRHDLMMPVLEKDNTLIYVCGLKGMETGIFQLLGQLGLFDYLRVNEELKDANPLNWTREQLKRWVRPGERMFLEVY